jgi:hypothetical protein
MTAADLKALARRAVACPRWRWMPGMQWTVERAEPLEDLFGRVPDDMRGWTPQPNAVPVFSGPATLGCLLALVRDAHGAAAVVYLPMDGAIRCWRVVTFAHGADWLTPARLFGEGATEAEALVAALERAP